MCSFSPRFRTSGVPMRLEAPPLWRARSTADRNPVVKSSAYPRFLPDRRSRASWMHPEPRLRSAQRDTRRRISRRLKCLILFLRLEANISSASREKCPQIGWSIHYIRPFSPLPTICTKPCNTNIWLYFLHFFLDRYLTPDQCPRIMSFSLMNTGAIWRNSRKKYWSPSSVYRFYW